MLGALEEEHLPVAAEMLAAEGWTFTPRELARLLRTGPELSVAAWEGEEMTGLLTVTRHGDLAWIGNVAVRPDRRGKGLGERMVREALARCEAAGVRCVKLCSVPRAVGLYARVGFRTEGTMRTLSLHHERPTRRPAEVDLLVPEDLPELVAMDRPRFGADRSALLAQLLRDYPDTGVAVRDAAGLAGFGFLKVGEAGTDLGPIVLREPDAGNVALLLDGALGFRLDGAAAGVECTIPAEHRFMEPLLRERGFGLRAESTLMAWGEPRAQDWARCAALGGLEKG